MGCRRSPVEESRGGAEGSSGKGGIGERHAKGQGRCGAQAAWSASQATSRGGGASQTAWSAALASSAQARSRVWGWCPLDGTCDGAQAARARGCRSRSGGGKVGRIRAREGPRSREGGVLKQGRAAVAGGGGGGRGRGKAGGG
jgi:hypothetical protein